MLVLSLSYKERVLKHSTGVAGTCEVSLTSALDATTGCCFESTFITEYPDE